MGGERGEAVSQPLSQLANENVFVEFAQTLRSIADETFVTFFHDYPSDATIQLPGDHPSQVRRIECNYRGMSDRRLSLVAAERVPSATALTVEYEDAMFLGEVVTCTEDVSHAFHIDIKVEQILTGLQSLMNLRANLLGEPVPAPLRMMPAGSSR